MQRRHTTERTPKPAPDDSPVPELIRALTAAVADGEDASADASPGAADARVDRELTRLVRLRRAQGHSLDAVQGELERLQDVVFDDLVDQARTAGRDVATPEAVLDRVERFHRIARRMASTSRAIFRTDAIARGRSRATLLGSFARTITHELRNRLNAARLTFSVVRISPEHRRAESLGALDESLKLLEEAVADLSSVALAQARELPAETRLVPLGELFTQLRADLDELTLARKIDVRLAAPSPDVAVDAAKLRLALINLVANAVKHADRGKPERWVEIRVGPGSERGEWRVDIEDNGLGLPVLELAMGEERSAPLRRPEIGVVLAQEAVRQLGGRLWVEVDTPGRGTTMSFTMRGCGRANA